MGLLGGRMLAHMEARLKLTPEQSQQVKGILEAQRNKMKERLGGGRKEHSALAQAIFSDNPNLEAIREQVTAMQKQHAQVLEEMVGTGLEINKVLTSEQRAELQQAMAEHKQVREKMRERLQQRREGKPPAPGTPETPE